MLPTPEPDQRSPLQWTLTALLTLVSLNLVSLSCSPTPTIELTYELHSCKEIRVQGQVQLRAQTGDRNSLVVIGPSISGERVESADNGFSLTTAGAGDSVEAELTCTQWSRFEALGVTQIVWENSPDGLHKIALYGASVANLPRLDAEHADLRAAGTSRLAIDQVLAEQIHVMASGASEVALTGSTTGLSIDAVGSSQVEADDLQAQRVTVSAGGSALLDVWATAHLSGRTKPGVQLKVRGNPDRHLDMGNK